MNCNKKLSGPAALVEEERKDCWAGIATPH